MAEWRSGKVAECARVDRWPALPSSRCHSPTSLPCHFSKHVPPRYLSPTRPLPPPHPDHAPDTDPAARNGRPDAAVCRPDAAVRRANAALGRPDGAVQPGSDASVAPTPPCAGPTPASVAPTPPSIPVRRPTSGRRSPAPGRHSEDRQGRRPTTLDPRPPEGSTGQTRPASPPAHRARGHRQVSPRTLPPAPPARRPPPPRPPPPGPRPDHRGPPGWGEVAPEGRRCHLPSPCLVGQPLGGGLLCGPCSGDELLAVVGRRSELRE